MLEQDVAAWARRLDGHLTAEAASARAPHPPLHRLSPRPARGVSVRIRPGVWVIMGLVLGVLLRSPWSVAPPSQAVPAFGALGAVASRAVPPAESCAQTLPDGRVHLRGACTWRSEHPAMEIGAFQEAWVRIENAHRVSVLEGWLVFDVAPVVEGPAVEIGVEGGTIEVLGTRFSVYQDGEMGHVELVEGRVRMLGSEGAETMLAPGDRFSWRDASSHVATQAGFDAGAEVPAVPESKRPRKPGGRSGDAGIRELSVLRAEGRYLEALDLARRLLGQTRHRRTREVLHYEAGTLIEGPIGDRSAACRHWAEHLERFQGGRYGAQVELRLQRLGCSG